VKTLLKFLGLCAAGVVIMVVIGAGMASHHLVTRRRSFAAPPERVWSALLSIRQLPFDRSDLRSVDQGTATVPPETIAVVGTPVKIQIETFRPPRTLVVKTVEPDVGWRGTWTFELELESSQITKVTVTEDAEVRNRLLRFAVRTLGSEDFLVDAIFRAVKRKLVETPAP
jgi:uncharacterized protein YndB with AHSA1/START domain